MPTLNQKDPYEKYRSSMTAINSYTISFCPICRGARSVFNYETEKEEFDSELAFKLAMEKFNSSKSLSAITHLFPKKCSCQEKLAVLLLQIQKLDAKVISDSKWIESYCTNTNKYYERIIAFSRPLNAEEAKLYCEYLRYNNCPGWTGIYYKLFYNSRIFVFETSWDSSG